MQINLRRRLGAGAVVAAAFMALAGPAFGSPPTVIHDRVADEFTDANFCGSGLTVDVDVAGVQNVRLDGDSFRSSGQVRAVLTNPENGNAVILSSAGQMRAELVSGDPDGLHTIHATFRGLAQKIQTADGSVLLRDAGVITFADTFDGQEFVGSEIVVNKGPHPQADSGFTLFCETVVPALI
jgi:hypothetical protein